VIARMPAIGPYPFLLDFLGERAYIGRQLIS